MLEIQAPSRRLARRSAGVGSYSASQADWIFDGGCFINDGSGNNILIYTIPQQPPVDQGFLIVEASRSHPDTPQSVELPWTSDQPVEETST